MMQDAERQKILAYVKGCLHSGDYSDLSIDCGGESHKVHKIIVCARAGFFARAIRFGGKEASENTINLPEDDPAIVKLLIQYLYEEEYEPRLRRGMRGMIFELRDPDDLEAIRQEIEVDTGPKYTYEFPHVCAPVCKEHVCPHHSRSEAVTFFVCTTCTRPAIDGLADQLPLHAKMYEIADKYDVHGLKELVQQKFKRACKAFWDEEAFTVAADHVFSTTLEEDKGLRDIVRSTLKDHVELVERSGVRALLSKHPGMMLDVEAEKDSQQYIKK